MEKSAVQSLKAFFFFSLNVFLAVDAHATETIGLVDYLKELRGQHPLFQAERLNDQIALQEKQALLGDQDWVALVSPAYQHLESDTDIAFFPREQTDWSVSAGLERNIWATGGSIRIGYDYLHTDQSYQAPIGGYDEHQSGLQVAYTMPLLENYAGVQSTLRYDLQTLQIDVVRLQSLEVQEQFLEQQGLRFLEWSLLAEQRRIAENRYQLALNELDRTKRKRQTNLVEPVEVLRAQDAAIAAEQNLENIQSQYQSLRSELLTQLNAKADELRTPNFDLYQLHALPDAQVSIANLPDQSRQVRIVQMQIAQTDRQLKSLADELKPELSLRVAAGLNRSAESAADTLNLDQPNYQVSLNYRMALGRSREQAGLLQAKIQKQKLEAEKYSVQLQLQARFANVIYRLQKMDAVLALSEKQISVAKQRTAEELSRHNQGRSELSFVIQSRDNEQNARLIHANNAVVYQKLWLNYLQLADALLTLVGTD